MSMFIPRLKLSRTWTGVIKASRENVRKVADWHTARPIEEQTLAQYHRKHYYPVRLGDLFKDRYRVISKLGYGAYSTVWLAWDNEGDQYVSLKIGVRFDQGVSPVANEVRMLRRLGETAAKADHPGLDFTRLATDIFPVSSAKGQHDCIVSKPQLNSLRVVQEMHEDGKLPKLLVRSLIHRLIFSINWLHAVCGVVHTEITPQNVLMEAPDDTDFAAIEAQELENPSKPVIYDGYSVYRSRTFLRELIGAPILTDFGSMQNGLPLHDEWAMPDLYRAPEILLQTPWSFEVDIWCLGVMTLELLEGRNVFDPIDRIHRQYVRPLALAQYISLLGMPPLHMLKKSPLWLQYFNESGDWISEPPIPQTSLEDFVTTIPPGNEKDLFLKFIRKIFTWDPAERLAADELVHDAWLMMPNREICR